MQVVYLDQNKWVDVARAVYDPERHALLHSTLTALCPALDRGDLVFPLSMSTLYETYKIGDPDRRHRMAHVQATFSQGRVFRGRQARLEVEASAVLRAAGGLTDLPVVEGWFLSDVFLEAFFELSDGRYEKLVPAPVADAIRQEPARFTYDWIMEADTDHRAEGVRMFSRGAEELLQRIERRRSAWADQSGAIRKRAYGATMLIDELDFLLSVARQIGLPWSSVSDMGDKTVRALIRDCPTLNAERELTTRLESQSRALTENDTRDMFAYTAAVPYADLVIGENQFINLARQGGLDRLYGTRLTANIQVLAELI